MLRAKQDGRKTVLQRLGAARVRFLHGDSKGKVAPGSGATSETG